MKEAGTVIVFLVSSSISSLRAITCKMTHSHPVHTTAVPFAKILQTLQIARANKQHKRLISVQEPCFSYTAQQQLHETKTLVVYTVQEPSVPYTPQELWVLYRVQELWVLYRVQELCMACREQEPCVS